MCWSIGGKDRDEEQENLSCVCARLPGVRAEGMSVSVWMGCRCVDYLNVCVLCVVFI